jgi:hypothetical protein
MAHMNQTLTLAQLIKQAIENRLLEVHTALVGRIERYDHQAQLADIQPTSKALPLLVDVPLLFPRAGDFFISLPVQVGDFVQVVLNESSIDDFLTETANKIDASGRFTLQGAVAIPGIYPFSKPITGAHKTNLVLGKDKGVQVHIDDEKIRLGSEVANEALALAKNVSRELEKFRTAFNSHTHIAKASTGTVTNAATLTQIEPIGNIATQKVVAQ